MTVNLVDLYGPGANGSPVSGRNDPFAANYSTKWGLRQAGLIRARRTATETQYFEFGRLYVWFLSLGLRVLD